MSDELRKLAEACAGYEIEAAMEGDGPWDELLKPSEGRA